MTDRLHDRQLKRGGFVSEKLMCRFCGAANSIDQLGHVRTSAWRKVESVKRGDDGNITATYGSVDTERWGSIYPNDFDSEGYRCAECEREEARLEDLIGDPVMFEPGAAVWCPDGLRGVVATVDFERRLLTVENWHEEFKFAEVAPVLKANYRVAA